MPYRSLTFLVKKRLDPRSIKAKLFLPIIPIGIVAYAFTLFWDNLCRNSCKHKVKSTAQWNPVDTSPMGHGNLAKLTGGRINGVRSNNR